MIRILVMSSRRGTFLFPTAWSLRGSYTELAWSQPSIPNLRNPHSRPQHSRISVQIPATEREIDTCKLRQRITEKSRVVEDAPKPHGKRSRNRYHSQRQNLPCGPVTAVFPTISFIPKSLRLKNLPKNRPLRIHSRGSPSHEQHARTHRNSIWLTACPSWKKPKPRISDAPNHTAIRTLQR